MLHHEYATRVTAIRRFGQKVGPRGNPTLETLDSKLTLLDSRYNLLDVPARHLGFRYAVAEWLWVAFGRSDVASILQYNPQLQHFTDDGIWFTGAYGPHINGGWHRLVEKLRGDPATRQAVVQIPRPQRMHTKDEPCTLSLQFINRNNLLHCIATMRSSDVWLGLPYDVFTFTMLQNSLSGELNLERGSFVLNAGSSHLYEHDLDRAATVVREINGDLGTTIKTPDLPGRPPAWLEDVLVSRDSSCIPTNAKTEKSVWLPFTYALLAQSNAGARYELTRVA